MAELLKPFELSQVVIFFHFLNEGLLVCFFEFHDLDKTGLRRFASAVLLLESISRRAENLVLLRNLVGALCALRFKILRIFAFTQSFHHRVLIL